MSQKTSPKDMPQHGIHMAALQPPKFGGGGLDIACTLGPGISSDGLRRYVLPILNCGPRGGTGGAKPGSGVQRFWGPLGASEFDPSFQ